MVSQETKQADQALTLLAKKWDWAHLGAHPGGRERDMDTRLL